MEELSKEQKEKRLQIVNSKDEDKIKVLKSERQVILRSMRRRMKEVKEQEIETTIREVETTKDDATMFKAVRELKKKDSKINYIHDSKGRCIKKPQEKYQIIEKHFKDHFQKPNINKIERFRGPPRRLNKEVDQHEIKQAVKMANNRAPGKDELNVELIKYGPTSLHEEISSIINDIFANHKDIETGNGILIPLPKPKKPKGATKNLRPITLLDSIRKIISKMLLNRIEKPIENYLAPNQSANRKKRSTTDIVWAHRWIAAKVQEQEITVYITGIDMTSAFDTIQRDELLSIAEEILEEDEIRILQILLSKTNLEIKVKGAESKPFVTNIGSPQGDSLSGSLFTMYLENALREVREAVKNAPIDVRDINSQWREQQISNLPTEIEYADDCDFITENEKVKTLTYQKVKEILMKHNLIINEDKTEETTLKREKERKDENWRKVKKLGSLLGDREDIENRKRLATVAINSNDDIWKRKRLTKLKTRIKLYKVLVENILLYNSGTWGMNTTDEKNIDSFHRKQLRKVLGVKWPQRISNKKLYEKTNTQKISQTIRERRWKLLGHIMRLPAQCPARKAMRFFFEKRSNKKFLGRKRTTIVTTLNKDIKKTKARNPSFSVIPLTSEVSLQNLSTKARNRKLWANIVRQVVDSAHSTSS